jgi:hypothetical protein
MDYRRGTNYALQGEGSMGYADYRTDFAQGMNVALVSPADPMKANTGYEALYEEEPGCGWKVCKWCMILSTVAIVVGAMVLGVMYTDCHDLPLVGVKDSCKAHGPAGSTGGGELLDEYIVSVRGLLQADGRPWW